MQEMAVLVLVFVAVVTGTWVLMPLIAQAGIERALGRNMPLDQAGPMAHFTTPARLAQACWFAALMGCALPVAALVACGVLNAYVLLGVGLAGGVLCYQVPRVWLRQRIKQRQLRFEARLLDLTLGLANGLRAGAALPQTIELVCRDIGGPMAEEFALVLHEYRLGIDLPESLRRLTKRMPVEDLNILVSSIRITMESGGSLAEVLDRITDTVRERTAFNERLRTLTAQGRFEAIAMAAAPVLCFFILFYLDRDLMMPLVTTTLGWCALAVVAVLEIVGFWIINRIVTIEV